MRPLAAAALATALVATLGACSEDPTGPVFQVIEEVTFDPSLGIDLALMTELPSGVYILDDPAGAGAMLAANDSITLAHTGWLSNGSAFSQGVFSSRHDATPPRFIEGFDIGLGGMAVGGTRLMIIPPELGFGAQDQRDQFGQVVIPGGSVLIFEVELQAILP